MDSIRIGLLGVTRAHATILAYTCRVADLPETDLTVYATPEKKEKVESSLEASIDVEWVVQDDDESTREFLGRVRTRHAPSLDLLVVNTIAGGVRDHLRFARFTRACPTVFWLYSINTWFAPRYALTTDLRSFARVNGSLAAKRLLRNRFDGVVVEYRPMLEYLREEIGYDGHAACLTHAVFDEAAVPDDPSVGDTVRCVVPGALIQRRDYGLVLDAFERLFERHGDGLELTILGPLQIERGSPAFKRDVLDRCRALESRGYAVRYYTDDWVPFAEYDARLAACDLCVNPVQRFEISTLGRTTETVGVTTGTGTVFDPLRFGKPMLLPEAFTLSPEIAPITRTYADEAEFEETLATLVRDRERLRELKETARDHAANFDLSSQREAFRERVLDRVLS